jgi:4-oxalmesaconate hydratase
MIVDAHGHVTAPAQMYEYQAKLIARRSPFTGPALADELIEGSLKKHLRLLDGVGTDVQFISPRPYTMAHSLFSDGVVRVWTEYVNDLIHRQVRMSSGRLRAVAGLPQFRTTSLEPAVEELRRCVGMGFVGCLLNPDPMEGEGPPPPGLGDEYWYPLYAALSELGVPALIHSASCSSPRESYSLHFVNEESIAVMSLLGSRVFDDFPDLTLVVAHGGGAIPYQAGRFRAGTLKAGKEDFLDRLRRLYYDTCLYSAEGLELLFKVIGPQNCLFGTETPGTGSAADPRTGRSLDDLRPVIDSLSVLTDDDRRQVYEGNARKLYPHAFDRPSPAEPGVAGGAPTREG